LGRRLNVDLLEEEMKVVVITGSTRGIGYRLAEAFLARGCAVLVSGRSQAAVDKALGELGIQAEHLDGKTCDVTDHAQVQALWDFALQRFGRVDIWINNAGQANPARDFWKHSPELIQKVVETNLVGAMYGSQVALTGFMQQGDGALYNMEGLGSSGGRRVRGLALYASTKAGLRYLDDSLTDEVKGTPVIVGSLRPGMVLTDLVLGQYQDDPQGIERNKSVFNLIAERAEVVAPWLAERILANHKNGVCLNYLTTTRILGRLISRPFHQRDLFTPNQ
jgi:NAD(P)-dependent dehydrogenase (short-subunit alcohol dehydrogenase family)